MEYVLLQEKEKQICCHSVFLQANFIFWKTLLAVYFSGENIFPL